MQPTQAVMPAIDADALFEEIAEGLSAIELEFVAGGEAVVNTI